MSFEEGDCFQSRVDGGIFRSQIQWKSFLRFEGEAQIVGGVLELAGVLEVREETGRLSPSQSVTAFRLSSMVIGQRVPKYIYVCLE